jgi:hypothetical protein
MRHAALALLCLSCLASGATRKGPYLIYPGDSTQMAVHWQLDVTAACTLSWGTTSSYELGSVVTTESGSSVNQHQHSRTLSGLTPGLRYYYRVAEAGGSAVNSSFCAVPSAGQQSLTLYAMGESNSSPDTFN